MRNIDEIIASINNLRHDIKAEVITADIIENGINEDDIVSFPDGLFKRRFNQDVSNAHLRKLNNGQEVVEVHTTRDGIYDTLPAGMFHDQPRESVDRGSTMASDSKKQRLIEKEARKFFQPLEHELFQKLVELELEERKILNRFSENLFDDIFTEFWKLDKTLPQKYLARLILLLHLAHKITGNYELTAKTLEVIIEEPVSVQTIESAPSQAAYSHIAIDNQNSIGSCTLGVDFVSGTHSPSLHPSLEFVIGPLRHSRIEDFLENRQLSRFLNCFYGYFVPMDMDVKTRIKVNENEQEFSLDPSASPILGYSTTI